MKHNKKIAKWMAACFLGSALVMSGCAQEEVYIPITEDTVEVTKDGNLVAYLVEDFDKAYYDIGELGDMVRAEIEAYNQTNAALAEGTGRTAVAVEEVSMAEDGSSKVVVKLNFANANCYEQYMGKELFYGTVSQAVASGYRLDGKLTELKDGDSFGTEEIVKYGEKTILIVEDTVRIRTNKKVLYLSANASLTEEGIIDGSSEEFKYIITK